MQLRKLKNIGVPYFHTLLLSLVIIVSTVRTKFLFFPPALSEVVVFSITTLTVAFIFFRISLLFLPDRKRAGVFSSAVLVFIFLYFDFFHGLFSINFIYRFIYDFLFQKFHVVLFFIGFFLLSCTYIALKKTKRNLNSLTGFLNLFAGIILLFEISKIFFSGEFEVGINRQFNNEPLRLEQSQKRNIYYMVMDSYTSSGSLKKYWNYDNKEFVEFLVANGFVIAEKSRCNYNSTPFSILSVLTMSYLNIENYNQGQKVHISKVFGMIQHSDVVRILSANGYEIVNLSLFGLMHAPAYYSDPYYHKPSLFDRTIFHLAADKFDISSERKLFKNIAAVNPEIISQISLSDKNDKPVFCYAHPMMPHEPFFFNEHGKKMPNEYAMNSEEKEKKYLSQLRHVNTLLMQTVESILKNSKIKPIIIIQGDHGFRYLDKINYDEQLEESKTIFNAYLLPGDTLKNFVYDSVSPVNSFRIIFNNYFGTELSLLEDTSFNIEIKPRK